MTNPLRQSKESKLKSAQAAKAFSNRDYQEALKLYEELSNLLGEKHFYANIVLCNKRIRKARAESEKDKSDWQTTNKYPNQIPEANYDASKKIRAGNTT